MADSGYRPQLATLVKVPPRGDRWLHEIKFDGYRIGCRIRNGRATLISRSGKDWTQSFPEIADAAVRLGARDALIDGEVAVVLPDGRTGFQHLQHLSNGEGGRASLAYFVFDLLRLEGTSLERLPLEARKARLRRLVATRQAGRIRYADHIEGRGEAFFAEVCRLGLEGVISKRRDLPYRAGRSDGWVKTQCTRRQEFVIGGFTDPAGTRAGLGALVIGHYAGDRLVFSGQVGTGFTEWTADGRIRHPSFQELRADTKPREVMRERPGSG